METVKEESKAHGINNTLETGGGEAKKSKTYDLGPCAGRLLGSCYKNEYTFDEEVLRRKFDLCWGFAGSETDYPYAEMSGYGPARCCWGIGINGIGEMYFENCPVLPGYPCCWESSLVKDFVAELRSRVESKGDQAQLLQDQMNREQIIEGNNKFAALNAKVDLLMKHVEDGSMRQQQSLV
uniref:Uncharacterized protein n=1 Tax=Lotharella oceanica TaxID=641309 RepID=A0A7S2TN88_9EUKA|mmetsp:Transcript_22001/g.41215  ORF Transcript_22001/g.41215 Transcript_22001/m.41215 type:complete len:181 (+) Transcript_22001:98-640(+)|eukprot:CAMPEP_0170185730 /NCGR_PEP_ID=MMETSP0040_2-20121228/37333_1 /TAXON_ID=641309 /ORGANISM="Lotharella oceanica, Strain CCMP622" /LENGTH=180 /DNA_ID=CAMNT_0010432229 /DNA_START=43 /DNA_END=585 /DNA_ORIENTATION=-